MKKHEHNDEQHGCATGCCENTHNNYNHEKEDSHIHNDDQEHSHHSSSKSKASTCSCAHEGAINLTPAPKSDLIKVPEGWVVSEWLVPEMDCPTEEGLIRAKLENQEGIQLHHCNVMKSIVQVSYEPSKKETIEGLIKQLGYTPQLIDPNNSDKLEIDKKISTKQWAILITSGIFAFGAELLHSMSAPEWLTLSSAILAIALCGVETFKNGLLAIKNRKLNINALMSVAVIGAILIKQWPEAAMVMFLFTIAELLESYSLTKAKKTIANLMQLTPEVVTIYNENKQWQEIPVAQADIGMTARVKPGERIALDGVITQGFSTINQAPITGESMPVEKQQDDPVFAGTINETGSFEYKITAGAKDTTLARIIDAVENAQSSRAPIQSFIEKFSSYYIPVIFALALTVAFVVPIFAGDWGGWIYKALVLLVIACPCALVISTPVTIVSALSLAAKNGILIKGGVFLEMGRKIKWLAVDKTGTLTHGKPKQTDFISFDELKQNTYNIIAASLANRSDHPVSIAIAQQAKEAKLALLEVDQFTAIAGAGTKGIIDGLTYYLVNKRFIIEQNIKISDEENREIDRLQNEGKTIVILCDENNALACFAVADTIKDDIKQTISQLHHMDVKTLMITGDNTSVANLIAKEVGIDEVYAEQLPEHKLNIVKEKQAQNMPIAMVGDGINDAPALAQADVGIAMGQLGADTAIETADIVLMDDKLSNIIKYIKISTKAYNKLVANISFAIAVKIIFIILTLFGLSSMWMAIFADVGATLLVVFNGLTILLFNNKKII